MIHNRVDQVIPWFISEHKDWLEDSKLVSWAEKLGIHLNHQGAIDEEELFHLFVLAVLWNNDPTYPAEKGEQVFREIKREYTLRNFREAEQNDLLAKELNSIAHNFIGNPDVFSLLMFIANGRANDGNIWTKIRGILNFPGIGYKADDVNRLKELFGVFNPRKYRGNAYLTVKTFLIFREIRIQFRNIGKYQYHPAICCIPDSNVRNALRKLDLLEKPGTDINSLISSSKIVAEYFCKGLMNCMTFLSSSGIEKK